MWFYSWERKQERHAQYRMLWIVFDRNQVKNFDQIVSETKKRYKCRLVKSVL